MTMNGQDLSLLLKKFLCDREIYYKNDKSVENVV